MLDEEMQADSLCRIRRENAYQRKTAARPARNDGDGILTLKAALHAAVALPTGLEPVFLP